MLAVTAIGGGGGGGGGYRPLPPGGGGAASKQDTKAKHLGEKCISTLTCADGVIFVSCQNSKCCIVVQIVKTTWMQLCLASIPNVMVQKPVKKLAKDAW